MDEPDDSPLEHPLLPAPSRQRHDGWTAERQEDFLLALAACGCVREACRAVGMSSVSAYALRARPSAIAFREAWDAALDHAMHRLEEAMLGRALNGVARPVFYKGEQVGEWRHFDDRLAMFLLRYRRAGRFGAAIDRDVAPDADESDAMGRLDYHLDELTDRGEPPSLTEAFARAHARRGANFANFGDDPDEQFPANSAAPGQQRQ